MGLHKAQRCLIQPAQPSPPPHLINPKWAAPATVILIMAQLGLINQFQPAAHSAHCLAVFLSCSVNSKHTCYCVDVLAVYASGWARCRLFQQP